MYILYLIIVLQVALVTSFKIRLALCQATSVSDFDIIASGKLTVAFPSNPGYASILCTSGATSRSGWNTIIDDDLVIVPGNIKSIQLIAPNSNGLCIDKVELNGEVISQASLWLDLPCEPNGLYGDITCYPEFTFMVYKSNVRIKSMVRFWIGGNAMLIGYFVLGFSR